MTSHGWLAANKCDGNSHVTTLLASVKRCSQPETEEPPPSCSSLPLGPRKGRGWILLTPLVANMAQRRQAPPWQDSRWWRRWTSCRVGATGLADMSLDVTVHETDARGAEAGNTSPIRERQSTRVSYERAQSRLCRKTVDLWDSPNRFQGWPLVFTTSASYYQSCR